METVPLRRSKTTQKTGLWLDIPHVQTPRSYLHCMLTEADLNSIVLFTNTREELSDFQPLSLNEFLRFIGQTLYMGLIKLPEHEDYWRALRPILAPSSFQAAMGYHRFASINATLHVEPEALIKRIRENFQQHRFPSSPATVDESRIRFKGRYSGIIFNPNKPDKSAIEFYSIADDTGYIYDILPRKKGVKIKRWEVVNILTSGLPRPTKEGGTYEIVANSSFGSLQTAESLEKQRMLYVLSCGKRYPSWLWGRELHPGLQQGETRLASKGKCWAVCTFSKKKVNLLTNSFYRGGEQDAGCTQPLQYYNAHKNGVDKANRLRAEYYYDHRHRKWTHALFCGLMKMAVTNAFIMYKENVDSQCSYRSFLEALIEDLLAQQ